MQADSIPYSDYMIDLRADDLCALGAISCLWGEINAVMEILILVMSGYDRNDDKSQTIPLILTSQISFHPRIRIIEAFVKHYGINDTTFNVYLSEFKKHLDKSRKKRNTFIHATWIVDSNTSPQTAYAKSSRLAGVTGYLTEFNSFKRDEAQQLIDDLATTLDLGWNCIYEFERRSSSDQTS
jgi:hypothetical protein